MPSELELACEELTSEFGAGSLPGDSVRYLASGSAKDVYRLDRFPASYWPFPGASSRTPSSTDSIVREENVMSELVVLTITVPATSNPNSSPLNVELTNGALSAGAAFKNIIWMSMAWAEGFDSGCNLWAPTSGGAALLAVSSSGGFVTGSIALYPASDVPVALVLTGRNAVVIGKQDLAAGETGASFSWPVGQDDGLSAVDVAVAINLFLQS